MEKFQIKSRYDSNKVLWEGEAANLKDAVEKAVAAKANLQEANLWGAYLQEADLRGADLRGATLPDGRKFEEYLLDPLKGICTNKTVRSKAIAAWGNHTWKDCPMHSAFGWNKVEDAPEKKRLLVSAFIALFDGELLPKPGEK